MRERGGDGHREDGEGEGEGRSQGEGRTMWEGRRQREGEKQRVEGREGEFDSKIKYRIKQNLEEHYSCGFCGFDCNREIYANKIVAMCMLTYTHALH